MPLLPLLFLLLQTPQTDATIEFENPSVRIVRVHYKPHQKTPLHEHPPTPTVYVYVTDGGRLKIGHDGETPVTRPAVKAGGIRFQKGVAESHVVEELDGVESEYIRIELKGEQVDLPDQDIRRTPSDRTPYSSGMIGIERITCAPATPCPASPLPSVFVYGKKAVWVAPNVSPVNNTTDFSLEAVRVEIKSKPRP